MVREGHFANPPKRLSDLMNAMSYKAGEPLKSKLKCLLLKGKNLDTRHVML